MDMSEILNATTFTKSAVKNKALNVHTPVIYCNGAGYDIVIREQIARHGLGQAFPNDPDYGFNGSVTVNPEHPLYKKVLKAAKSAWNE